MMSLYVDKNNNNINKTDNKCKLINVFININNLA